MRQQSHSKLLKEPGTSDIHPPSEPSVVHCLKGQDKFGKQITTFILVPASKLQSFLSSKIVNLNEYYQVYSKLGHDVSEGEMKDVEDYYRSFIRLKSPIEHNFYKALCSDNLGNAIEAVQQNRGVLPLIDNGRVRPLHIAARNGCKVLIPWLIEVHGCKIDDVDEYGSTPLHEAARKNKLDTLLILKQHDYSNKDVLILKNNEGLAPIEILENLFSSKRALQFNLLYSENLYNRVFHSEATLVQLFASNPMFRLELKPSRLFFSTVIPLIFDFYLPVDWYAQQLLESSKERTKEIDESLSYVTSNASVTILNVLSESAGNLKVLTSESDIKLQSEPETNNTCDVTSRSFTSTHEFDQDHAMSSSPLSSHSNHATPVQSIDISATHLSVLVPNGSSSITALPSPPNSRGEYFKSVTKPSTASLFNKGKRTLSPACNKDGNDITEPQQTNTPNDCNGHELSCALSCSPSRSYDGEFYTPPSPLFQGGLVVPCLQHEFLNGIVRSLSPEMNSYSTYDHPLKIELPVEPHTSSALPKKFSTTFLHDSAKGHNRRPSKELRISAREKDDKILSRTKQNCYTSSLSAPSSPLCHSRKTTTDIEYLDNLFPENDEKICLKSRSMSACSADSSNHESKNSKHKSHQNSKRCSNSITHYKQFDPALMHRSDSNSLKHSRGANSSCPELSSLVGLENQQRGAKLSRPSDSTVMSSNAHNPASQNSNLALTVLANGQLPNSVRSIINTPKPLERNNFLSDDVAPSL